MVTNLFSPTLATNGTFVDGYQIGTVIGSIIVIGIASLGIAKCLQILRRPRTHTLCVLSLVFFLLAWVVGVAMRWWRLSSGGSLTYVVILTVVQGLLLMASLLLGIIGLVDYSRHRQEYLQGRRQAGWSIALSLLALAVGTYTIADAFQKVLPPPVEKIATSEETLGFPQLNCRFDVPPPPWVQFDAKKLNPDASLGFIRSGPQVYFILIAEKGGVELDLDTRGLLEIVKANIRSRSNNVQFYFEREDVIDGIAGVRFEADATVQGRSLSFSHWVGAENGFFYQMMVWGAPADADRKTEAADRLFRLFHRIDPARIAHGDGIEAAGRYESNSLGYAVDLADMGWRQWGDLAEKMPAADYGALRSNDTAMLVVPLPLDTEIPDFDALIPALLSAMEFEYPAPGVEAPAAIQQDGLPGFELSTKRRSENGTEFTYRLRVLRGRSIAYLLAAWCQIGSPMVASLEDVLDRVELRPDAAASDDSIDPDRRKALASVVAQLGVFEEKRDRYEEAAVWFERAFRWAPDTAGYLMRWLGCLNRLDRHEEALEILESHINRFESNLDAKAWLAFLNLQVGRTEDAERIYAELFREGYEGENDLLDFINFLVDAERYDDAIAQLERFLEDRPSMRVRRWLATMHSRKGDHETAIRQLLALQEEGPFDVEVALSLAEAYEDASRPSDAIEVCDATIARGYDTARAYRIKGRSELQLEWYRRAKSSFEKALEKDPNDESARDELRVASGHLGEGDNSAVKDPIPPVEIPDALRTAFEKTVASTTAPEAYGVRYLTRHRAIRFEKGKELRTTYYHRAEILTVDGAREMSSLEFEFDPLWESIFVNRVIVRDPEGRIVAEGKIDDCYVLDSSDDSSATHDKVVHVPVPGLHPKCTIEYVVSRRQRGIPEGFEYVDHRFSTANPVASAAVIVTGDIEAIRHRSSPGIEPMRGDGWIAWHVEDPPVYAWEPLQPPDGCWGPTLRIVDASASWQALSEEYLDSIGDVLELDDATRSLAVSLIGDAETVESKVGALARHVQKEINYTAIEFGRRASIPNPCAEIESDRYGDCKDHSLLLHQLLRGVGVESHLALVNTQTVVDPELPTREAFNHMIVFVPGFGGSEKGTRPGRFVDCTDKNTDVLAATPLGLSGRWALVLDPKRPHLERTPEYPEDSSTFDSTRRIRLEIAREEALAFVSETLTLGGLYGGAMRGFLRAIDPGERREAVADIMESYATIRLDEFSIDDLEAPEKPLVLHLEYVVEDAFRTADDRWVGALPSIWERDYITVDRVENRRTPFFVAVPTRYRSHVELLLPPDHSPSSIEWMTRKESTRYAEWNDRANVEEGVLIFDHELRTPEVGLRPAEEYASYCDSIRRAAEPFEHPLVIKRSMD